MFLAAFVIEASPVIEIPPTPTSLDDLYQDQEMIEDNIDVESVPETAFEQDYVDNHLAVVPYVNLPAPPGTVNPMDLMLDPRKSAMKSILSASWTTFNQSHQIGSHEYSVSGPSVPNLDMHQLRGIVKSTSEAGRPGRRVRFMGV